MTTIDDNSNPTDIAKAIREGGLQVADPVRETETPSAEGQAPAATEETEATQAPAAEAPSAEGSGDAQEDPKPEADAGKPNDLSDLPDWAQDLIKGLRGEAAKERVKKNEALKDAIPTSEVEKIKNELQAEITQLRTEGLRAEVARKFNLPDALAKRLSGSTKEELEADAQELQSFVGEADSRELFGGLTPGREATVDTRALAHQIRQNRLF